MNDTQKEQVISIIKEVAGKPDAVVTEETLLDELEIDAGELATIDQKLEETFNVVLPDDAVAKSETVKDIIELLDSKLETN